MTVQRSVVESLDREGLRPRVKIMVGGAPVTRKWAEEIGADGYAKNASEAVTLAREFMAAKLGACR
jgi:dimethylamine corrinoid protein